MNIYKKYYKMSKTIIEENVEEILDGEIISRGTNTYFVVNKKHRGKQAKLLVIENGNGKGK